MVFNSKNLVILFQNLQKVDVTNNYIIDIINDIVSNETTNFKKIKVILPLEDDYLNQDILENTDVTDIEVLQTSSSINKRRRDFSVIIGDNLSKDTLDRLSRSFVYPERVENIMKGRYYQ
jgi:hypothetical protein